jgi:guanylate kinase
MKNAASSMPTVTPPPLIFLISGPSGVGKTTICTKLLGLYPSLKRAITTTSRPPRPNEKEGVDYYFISAEEFEAKVHAGEFYEYARVHGQWKGVYRSEIQRLLDGGKDVLLNVDVQGAYFYRQLTKQDALLQKRLVTVFLMPASIDVLRERLSHRGDTDSQDLEHRLKEAAKEISEAPRFDHRITSGTPENDLIQVESLYCTLKIRQRYAAAMEQMAHLMPKIDDDF